MSTFEEKFAASKTVGGTETVETEVIDVADATTVDEVIAEAPVTVVEEQQAPETQNQPDYNKFLEESSEGLFKNVDDFKNSLVKIKEYDTIKSKAQELEEKANKNPFANDYIKKWNDLIVEGKSEEQIESWQKLQKLGDLEKLEPFEIKVQKLIWDGYKRDAAERKVTREFKLDVDVTSEYLSEDELQANKILLEDAQTDLAMSSVEDLKTLNQLKVTLGETKSYEQKELDKQNFQAQITKSLEPVAKNIVEQYIGIGELNVNGKDGADAVKINFGVDEVFKQKALERTMEYFIDGGQPVNEETIAGVKQYLDAVWLAENRDTFANTIYNQAYAKAKEENAIARDNPSGLPISGLPPITDDTARLAREQRVRLARGE